MCKLLILSFFLPLMAWAQAATNLSEGEYFGVSSNVEIEASLQSGFLLFKKFAPIDRSSGVSLRMTCHGGGISALNRIRVSAGGTFSGTCDLHHGKAISRVLDGVNNKNLEVKGTFPRLVVVSPNSEVGEIQVTLVPTSMRTEFHRLRNQGNITASSGLTNPTKSPAEADRAKENHVGGFQPNSSNQAAFTHSRQKIQAFFDRSDLRNLSWRLKIESLLRFELVDWLSPTIGLDEIPTPSYPAALSLKQEPWETNKEFEDRVEKARTERRLAIER
ncbi:MAG: hypothetical protein FJY58_10235, partial [Betaproteobacteria bacterium]|nr:hypothetical protein [Betaproteobacteria bacterium]